MTNYFNVSNVFEYGRNNPDVSCERAFMATGNNEYFTDVLDTLNEYQDRYGQIFSIKKIIEAVICFMDEVEEEIKHNISDSKEGVDDISNSNEQVDDISNSNEQVDAESEGKAYSDYIKNSEF